MQNSNSMQSVFNLSASSAQVTEPIVAGISHGDTMFEKLSDRELYKKCQEIGAMTLKYRKQFLGMIPEVEKRKLYLQHGMHDIYEFAAKLAGVNHEVVNEVLRIHRLLNDAPKLQEKLISGEISYTKLRSVATIVTKENQEVWLEKVETMSRPTLEVYVKDIRRQEVQQTGTLSEQVTATEHRTGQAEKYAIQDEQLTGMIPVNCGLPWKESEYETLSMKVNLRTAAKMRVFKRRLERKSRKPLNWDEALQEILKLAEGKTKRRTRKTGVNIDGVTRHEKIKKAVVEAEGKTGRKTKEIKGKSELAADECNVEGSAKHRAPAVIQHQVLAKNQGICDFPGCNKPGEILHHTERFALNPEHDPDKITYLCKPHERIAHNSLIKNEQESPENWQQLLEPDKNNPKYLIDSLVQKFRTKAVTHFS